MSVQPATKPTARPSAATADGELRLPGNGAMWLFVAVIAVGLGDPGRFGNGPTHADYVRGLTAAGVLWWLAALLMVWRWWKGRQPLFVSVIWFFVAIVAAPIALGA